MALVSIFGFSFFVILPFSGGEVAKHHQYEKKENGPTALGPAALSADRGVKVNEQKRFGGPGSSPPSCRSKCGWCTPCIAVHVPIQPGLSFPLEYYPEAWRCKCGNKLFMP